MKRVVSLIALLLFAASLSRPDTGGTPDTTVVAETICITSDFAVDIDYPNFLVSILAHVTGAHTERLTLVEWDVKTPLLSTFLLHLTDDDQARWCEIASDTSFPSFVKLPLTDRTAISPGALAFLKHLLQFFQNPRTDTLHAAFEYGKDSLGAIAYQHFASADTGFQVTTISCIETWNERTGEDYMNAKVTAITQEGYTAYPDIRVLLKDKNLTMRFTPLHVTVARTRP